MLCLLAGAQKGHHKPLCWAATGDHHVHHCKLLWAATGEWVVDPAWYTKSPVRSYRVSSASICLPSIAAWLTIRKC